MYKNVQTNPEKFQNLTQHSYCSMLTLGNFASNKRQRISFLPKGGTFPTETITLVVRSSGLWEAYTPNLLQMGQFFLPRHVDATPWQHAMFHEFRTSFGFTRIIKPGISMFAPEWRCQGVWHSFQFLAWDLSMHPRTHIWIFNQFICIRACACSSNLNYAHKMHWKLS